MSEITTVAKALVAGRGDTTIQIEPLAIGILLAIAAFAIVLTVRVLSRPATG